MVLGYWDQMIRSNPDELQALIEKSVQRINAPYLAIFGREFDPAERDYMVRRITDLQLEEWAGSGHFVHLSNIERFTSRLHDFIKDYLTQP